MTQERIGGTFRVIRVYSPDIGFTTYCPQFFEDEDIIPIPSPQSPQIFFARRVGALKHLPTIEQYCIQASSLPRKPAEISESQLVEKLRELFPQAGERK